MQKITNEELKLLMNKRPILTTKQLSELFGYKSTDALRKQRSKGHKPLFPYIKIGKRIFYDLSKILELAEQKLVKADR